MRFFSPVHRVRGWSVFFVASLLVAGMFPLLPHSSPLGAMIYIGVGYAEVAALVLGLLRHRPPRPWPWRLLIGGAALYSIANTIWYGAPVLLHHRLPFPSAADAMFIAAYGFLIAGLVALVLHRRGTSEGIGVLVDAAIVTFSAGVLAWEYLIEPLDTGVTAGTLARTVVITYPAVDLALVALLGGILMSRGSRGTPFVLLCGAVVAQLGADSGYLVTTLHGSFYYGHPLTVGWIVSFGCLGAAALHPDMDSLPRAAGPGSGKPMSWRRLVVLATATAVIPVFYLLQPRRASATEVLTFTMVVFVLCIARIGVLVFELSDKAKILARKERELRGTVDLLRRTEGDLKHQAHHDVLTGLANRKLFEQRLERARLAGPSIAVMTIDLDGFKTVNDSLGHAAGDVLLATVARRLAQAVRLDDTVARIGGDEFTVLVRGIDEAGAARLASRVLSAVGQPVEIEGRQVSPRASIGIALSTNGHVGWELLRDADEAMYEAKRRGGQRYEMFTSDIQARVLGRLELECDLRQAALGDEVTVHYQPVVDLLSGHVRGFEALLRWRHPERGLVSPAEFIPVAEDTGLIVPIGRWVLEQACHQVRSWDDHHRGPEPLGISVNVSARQLIEPRIVDDVAVALDQSGLDAGRLTLEVTETMMIGNEDEVCGQLDKLKALGVRISVDDFGTGYSSLSYIRRFPVDEVKIDRSFVSALGQRDEAGDVALAIVRLAQSLRLDVVAEGIETEEQLAHLRRWRCTRGQGYLLGKPSPPDIAGELLCATVEVVARAEVYRPLVLVVDDEQIVRRGYCRVLEDAGFETVEASTGREALDRARSRQIDAVLLDLRLPDIDGWSVCRSLRAQATTAQLPVVCFSGSAVEVSDRVRSLAVGADTYVTKPVVADDLIATVRATMRSRDCSLLPV